jgi:hypothetical protein
VTIKWAGEDEFWQVAAQNAPLRFRLLRRSLTVEQIEPEVAGITEWAELKKTLQNGDLIWPFEFNQRTLAYRKGFVVVRGGKPIGGVITVSS